MDTLKIVTQTFKKFSIDQNITLESRLVEDLGVDSLDIIESITELEEIFNIEIPDIVMRAKTVADIVATIIRLRAKI